MTGFNIEDFLEVLIERINGDKIVTLNSLTGENQQFDISEDGAIGYDEEHEDIFLELLSQIVLVGGSIVIREFTKLKFNDNGKKIPYKNLYGFFVGNGEIFPISKDELRESFETDHLTGERLPSEKGVVYKSISL